MAELILKTDTLNQGREKLNAAIKDAESAKNSAGQAIETSNQAKHTAEKAENKAESALQYTVGKYLEPVDTFDDIATTYPNAEENDRVFVRDTGKVYILQNGVWQEYLEITAGPVNEVDKRLSEQIDHNKTLIGKSVFDYLNLVNGDDWTAAIQAMLDEDRLHVLPPGRYRITDELIVGRSRVTLRGSGSSLVWLPERDTVIYYDGPADDSKAVMRVATAPVGEIATVQLTNIQISNIVLDGNGKAGYGLYANYVTNDSSIHLITAINCTQHNIFIAKGWYASYRDLVGAFGLGNGITIGKGFTGWATSDYQVNSVYFSNLRGFDNGKDLSFNRDTKREWGYGIGLYDGYNLMLRGITCERNDGAGLVFNNKTTSAGVVGSYFERNGQRDSIGGKDTAIIYVGNGGGGGHYLRDTFLVGEQAHTRHQTIWLTGNRPRSELVIDGVSFGKIIAEWSDYKLNNAYFGLAAYIEGHAPKNTVTVGYGQDTLYVRSNGSDNNDGRTPTTAFATLTKAVEMAEYFERVTKIDCAGLSTNEVTLDFSKIRKEIRIDGVGTAKIINSTAHTGFGIKNNSHKVTIANFGEISRVIADNAYLHVLSSKLSLKDNSATPCLNAVESRILLESTNLDGNDSTASVKNGIRSIASEIRLKGSNVSGFNNDYGIENSGTILADRFMAGFNSVNFRDSSGYVVGGNRMVNAFGSVTFS